MGWLKFGRTDRGRTDRGSAMDAAYVQGLRDAKALLDEGIFSSEEFMREKESLLKQREDRTADRHRVAAAAAAHLSNSSKRKTAETKVGAAMGKPAVDDQQKSKWSKYRKKCMHGKDTYECRACGGKRMCEHKKRRTRCKECAAAHEKVATPTTYVVLGVTAMGGAAQPPPPLPQAQDVIHRPPPPPGLPRPAGP